MPLLSMAKTITQSLFRKPATLMYPIKVKEYPKNTRGKIAIDINACTYCTMCQRKCPTNAITVKMLKKDGENSWTIDRLRCISCNACVDACPKKCLSSTNIYMSPSVSRETEIFKV